MHVLVCTWQVASQPALSNFATVHGRRCRGCGGGGGGGAGGTQAPQHLEGGGGGARAQPQFSQRLPRHTGCPARASRYLRGRSGGRAAKAVNISTLNILAIIATGSCQLPSSIICVWAQDFGFLLLDRQVFEDRDRGIIPLSGLQSPSSIYVLFRSSYIALNTVLQWYFIKFIIIFAT